ncbi:unnamed protein product, partial [Durusdinium trenchii]
MRSGDCYAGAPLIKGPGQQLEGRRMSSKCASQQEGVQRLCVCRSQGEAPLNLQSASVHFALRESDAATRSKKAFAATKERRSRPNLKRFGETLHRGAVPRSQLSPAKLSILLVVPDGGTEEILERTVRSLVEAGGFAASAVLLAHTEPKLWIANLAETYDLSRLQVELDQRIRWDQARRAALYKGALETVLKREDGSQVVLTLSYGDLVAPDAL